jgi:hypothetical protein
MQTIAQGYTVEKARSLGHPVNLDEFEIPPWDVSARLISDIEQLAELHQKFIKTQHAIVRFKESVTGTYILLLYLYYTTYML